MYKLGMILLNGLLGQPKNPREAVTWLKKAAAQADEENPHALHELAALYEKPQEFLQNGQPVPSPVVRDEAQARELYTQAAQLGHSPSQYKLGSCYEYGSLTCPVEPRRSIAWYTVSVSSSSGESH
jgi:TPR repeat protein